MLPICRSAKLWLGLTILLLSLLIPVVQADNFSSNELKLKILYLYNFSKLTEWPESTFESEDTAVNICIYGDDRYAHAAQALSKKQIKKRSIKILTITSAEQVAKCHALLIAKNSRQPQQFLTQAYQHNVLTTGDDNNFIKHGGIIGLIKIGNKIRFEINLGAINNKQLKISSKLLRLAKTIHRKQITD